MTFDRAITLRQATGFAIGSGLLAIVLFFGALFLWSATVPLTSAAITHGVVIPEGSTRIVQHREGGLIKALYVKDGDLVQAGDLLVRLEDKVVEANLLNVSKRLLTLQLIEKRLLAETRQTQTFEIASDLLAATQQLGLQDTLASQANLFTTRRATLTANQEILQQRIEQLQQEIKGGEAELQSLQGQLALIDQETATQQALVEKGFAAKPRLLALQRAQAGLNGDVGKTKADIAKTQQAIGEAQEQIVNLQAEYVERANQDLAQAETDIVSLREQQQALTDQEARLEIHAPVTGRIMNLLFHTEGGVVPPGGQILAIVPSQEALVISVHVNPNDIDHVRPGLSAKLVFPAFNQRTVPKIEGTVSEVSADRIVSQDGREIWFEARIQVSAAELARLGKDNVVRAGMSAEAFIVTGEETALHYLTAPLRNSLAMAFHES
ncbi:MAG TPA: HlyD family type I secretion periplasmic adaptor subunit [Terriglobales bacterium]|nr:HlyD family type I secretion periplasmic adaptor subunit [Terriglobales bacterium]